MSSSESTLRITHDPSGGTCWIKPPACVGTHNASTATTATGAANSDLLKRTMRSALTRLESCTAALKELPILPQLPPGPSPRFHENGLTNATWYSPPPEKILTRVTSPAPHSGKTLRRMQGVIRPAGPGSAALSRWGKQGRKFTDRISQRAEPQCVPLPKAAPPN